MFKVYPLISSLLEKNLASVKAPVPARGLL